MPDLPTDVPHLRMEADGWVSGARRVPSPNFDARPPGMPVDLLVIHNISLPPGQFGSDDIEALFLNRLDPDRHPFFATIHRTRVSAHFLVRRGGELVQFVSCHDRAWHAGQSRLGDRERCNDFSIGIELEGCDTLPFEPPQYAVAAALARVVCDAYPIAAVVGHSDIAPGRKTDPGPCFDWERFAGSARLPVAMLPFRGGGGSPTASA